MIDMVILFIGAVVIMAGSFLAGLLAGHHMALTEERKGWYRKADDEKYRPAPLNDCRAKFELECE